MFEEAGLPHAGNLEKVPNSTQALMLSELARERGLLDALHPRLFDAYWTRARDLGDRQVLIEEGAAVGLDKTEIVAAISDPEYMVAVQAQTQRAIELGAGGVPAWVINDRVLVPGAQPHGVFEQVLGQLGHLPLEGTK